MLNKYIRIWLISACLLIMTMVIIGGITRLTHSGLSMVHWKPVSGIIPPVSDQDWQAEFDHYKNYPEFKLINYRMTLSEFKAIFFWEYLHRLLGRLLGLLFLIPFVVFHQKKLIPANLYRKLFVMFGWGFLQGLMGWFMVKSGLSDNPSVSHYRLAAHFLLAFGLVGYIFWILMDYSTLQKYTGARGGLRKFGIMITVSILIQMIYGALTAGLKAGFAWNSFPLMNGAIFPEGLFSQSPFYLNLLENNMTVQFIHRWIAITLVFLITGLFLHVRRKLPENTILRPVIHLMLIVWLQALMGICTLLMFVPVWLAVLHQITAVVLFLFALKLNWVLK